MVGVRLGGPGSGTATAGSTTPESMKRPTRPRAAHYGPGGLPTEGAKPPPATSPVAPWLALVACLGFLALQLWPATHYRHPLDPHKEWHPIPDGKVRPAEERADPLTAGEVAEAARRTKSHELLRRRQMQDVQIFVSTDEKDLRPLVVVINSTLSNARHPEKIKFHVVIPTSGNQLEYYKLTSFFPHTSINIVSEGIDLEAILTHIKYREGSKARKDLSTPYNFLPFYLPRLLKDKDFEKIIYLDTDVVVKGDIEELYSKGLGGHPVAAVKDCSQRFRIYFDFAQLDAIQAREHRAKPWLPNELFDEEECVYNRGVLLIDVGQWLQNNVTEAIEWWMEQYERSDKPLYNYGMSQPPFLLALYKNYKELESAWNVRGLGREKFSTLELEYMTKTYGRRPPKKPFLSLESDFAKILHFNGQFKPWKRDRVRLPSEDVVSLCGQDGDECYKLWWEYLSPRANDAFMPAAKRP